MGRLEGKVALITGAGSGIGLAAAKRFVREGAKVMLTGRRRAVLAELADELGKESAAYAIGHEAHELLGYLMLALVALHVAAALRHHFILRDGILRRML